MEHAQAQLNVLILDRQALVQKIERLQIEQNKLLSAFNLRINEFNDKKRNLEAAKTDINIARANI